MHIRITLLLLLGAPLLAHADLTQEEKTFFETKIRPALVKHCYECHSQESEKAKGGLLLDTRDAILRGGDTGAALVPGDPDKSLMIAAIAYEDSSLEMPPKYKLEDAVIADFRKWIEMGAPEPRESNATGFITSVIDIEAGREFWAYKKPQQANVPQFPAGSWPVTDIDRYIYKGLREANLEPVADADPATLLRRLHYDLIGLPPSPEQVVAFTKSYAKDKAAAVAAAVDELLASPQFGERWGRHWLDIARYAETNGKDVNVVFYPEAWRYRDYVIKSFNEDKPYDVFLTEQIAGDLMPAKSDEDWAENLVGTGFLALGSKQLNLKSEKQFRYDLVDEQIQTLGKAMLGTSISCARCHDHKFDPIPQSDYYAMAGIFLSSNTWYGTYSSVQNRHATKLIELPVQDSEHAFEPLSAEGLEDKRTQLSRARQRMRELVQARNQNPGQVDRQQLLRLNHVITMLETELNTYDANGNPIALAMGVTDSDNISDSAFLVRGEVALAKDSVPRGFLQVLSDEEAIEPLAEDSSGRLELARWIASPENPLTARVMVNRVWMHLMGDGIVTSVDNFGATGSKPSHPELLDHLALQFVAEDWSVKKLIREIVLSRTYQLSSTFESTAFTTDPENALRWRADKRRLDAESLRDSLLAISGALELEPPYGSVIAVQSRNLFSGGTADIYGFEFTSPHRSVYLPIVRKQVPDSLDIFDFADPSTSVGKRETTTVPSQALFLMNSDFVRDQAEAMAHRLIDNEDIEKRHQGVAAFYFVYGRPPSKDETRKSSAFFVKSMEFASQEVGDDRDAAYREALTNFCHALLTSADFLYIN
ncbi:MAG: PSD1 and planctomycete cytochrome C domain-containing protein [Verrucomicrobiota bacterium]